MSYEKHPDYACDECHRSYKNKRALKQHQRDVHSQTFADVVEDNDDDDDSDRKWGVIAT